MCGILAANQGSHLFPLHWKLRVLTTGLLGKSQGECFLLLLLNVSSLRWPLGSKGPSLYAANWPSGPRDKASPPEPQFTHLSPRVVNPPAVWLLERRCLKLPALLAGFWGGCFELTMSKCSENHIKLLTKRSRRLRACFHDLAENAPAQEALFSPLGQRP